MRRTGIAALALLVLMAGCGSQATTEPEASPTPTPVTSPTPTSSEPDYVESDACRADAQPVLDIIELALQDTDVHEVAGRLDTIDQMLPEVLAQCSGATARPTRQAVDALDAAFQAAMSGSGVGRHMIAASKDLAAAQSAIDATR